MVPAAFAGLRGVGRAAFGVPAGPLLGEVLEHRTAAATGGLKTRSSAAHLLADLRGARDVAGHRRVLTRREGGVRGEGEGEGLG